MFEFKLEISVGSGILKFLSKLPEDTDIVKLMNYIVNIPITLTEYEQIKNLKQIESFSSSLLLTTRILPNQNTSNDSQRKNITTNINDNPSDENDDETLCFLKGIQICFTSNFFLLPTTDKLTKE